MSQRRGKSSQATNGSAKALATPGEEHAPSREHEHEHDHEHEDHSHSIFSGHSHSHGDDGHSHGQEKIMEALQGSGDRGSRITLIGLFSNVALTGAKGAAGWYMHSASLLADAGHSLSDLLGDFIVLFCWKLSRKPPSQRYPYGFAKFETLGTTTVSLILIGGALGIGFHSYHLLVEALSHTASTLEPGTMQTVLQNVTTTAKQVPAIGHGHSHGVDMLDPNAAWFAAVGVIAKEWLYRITKKVADEEHSPVLLANAIHHRSDAYSSVVAFLAILGTWFFPALPLDPLGGLLVSVVILQQGLGLFAGAFGDLTDAGVSTKMHGKLIRILEPLSASSESTGLLGVRNIRGRRAGSLLFVDLTADIASSLTVREMSELEGKITRTLMEARKEIKEVQVRFCSVE